MKSSFMHRFAAAMLLMTLGAIGRAQGEYKTYDEARSAAAPLIRSRKLAEAQAPLEAALQLAPDDKARLDVYQALTHCYRLLPEIDKKLEADEFIIRHSDRRAARSIAARDATGFLYQRGKVDAAVERYESQLKANPNDPAALAVLAEIFTRVKRDAQRGPEFSKRLDEVDRGIARKVAERMEQEAEASPRQSAGLLKDAAQLWLEAGEKAKAQAAARRSADGPPEERSEILAFFWRDGLGDVFLATADPKSAIKQFEAALGLTKIEGYRKATEKKLADAKEAAALQ